MSYFKFCPNCASQNIEFENHRRFECFDCGMVYYQNVAAAVAVIMERNDEILFTVRNREPKLGMLDLPGGFTDSDETSEETCQRELMEELDLEIPLENFNYFKSQPNNYLYKGIPYKTEDLVFIAQFPENAELKLEESEIREIKWIKKSEIRLEEIGFDSLRKAVEEYIEMEVG
ncbi:NUDIX hydrolase [Moheibacter lacus]|uniref:NUDIX domain-containing protein n=1 Tax=Moheibacter lacus TaxID=2745851 RepID=A0A838ZR41_9FLAO|nr:NUDIX domain-containing protein [Moheibacter lacus]MBA5628712.1 NUDIX domain-containing protein [Moheibacter lacus]